MPDPTPLTEAQRVVLKWQRARRLLRRVVHGMREAEHETRVMMVNFRHFKRVLKEVRDG